MRNLFLIVLFLFSTSNLSALILDQDNFSSYSSDNWSRDDGDSNELQINHDRESHKTFNFSSAYNNAEVTVTLRLQTKGGWETSGSSQDYFQAQFNNGISIKKYYNDGTRDVVYTTNLDSNANLLISLYANTTSSSEYVEIDFVTIEYTAPAVAPVIIPSTFVIYNQAPNGTLIGTVSTIPASDIFSIINGDIDNAFAINNNGDITVDTANLDLNTTSSYTLEIEASNAIGMGTGNITINLTDDIELSTEDVNTRTFTNVPLIGKDSITINGSILQIGNQLLCKNSYDGATCQEPSAGTPNNDHNQHKARIDTSTGAPSTNTMAKLLLEPNDEVIFARLYWSARINNITSTQKTDAKNIEIKGPKASTYSTYTSLNAKYNWHKSGSAFDYVASADVTDYVKAQGSGEYYAGGIVATNGYGQYASWQLIVIVENASRSLKNLSIFDGFYSVFDGNSDYPDSTSVDASGFITPTGSEPFNASLFIYMGESDSSYRDSVEILSKDGDENVATDWLSLVDGANSSNDVVNASAYSLDYTGGYRSNDAGMANPNYRNVLGIDIDKLPINIKEDLSKQKLSNSQTSTKIKITSDGDRFSLNMFAFETEVFVPEFCYDYAYSQYDSYFTEDNDGTNPPRLTGSITANEPIEVSIFIKSLVDSSILIDNMSIDVSDINITQTTYIADSSKVALVGDLEPNSVSVTAGTTLDGFEEYIHNIEIGSLNQNDYFYVYYQLNPLMATLDMPMTIEATYDLTLDTTAVEYKLRLSEDIPMCSYNNFNYLPARGIFNVVHNNYYTNTSTNKASPNGNTYYNIPTQVTSREGNFKVISLDTDDYDKLVGRSTMVAVELIDAGAFHYTDASCKELESSISERVWILFENNTTQVNFDQSALQSAISDSMTNITNSPDFYQVARQNSAFRVTYNSMDSNDSVPYIEESSGLYNIMNWRAEWSAESCTQDMNNDPSDTDLVSDYCNLSGGSTKGELTQCMECIYAKETHYLCSRDNFALRPEAFLIKINDQNQTDGSSKLRIDDNVSGVPLPLSTQTELASGYNYSIELNATNHLNNKASIGYTKVFTAGSTDIVEYAWEPSNSPTGCNDTNSTTITPNIINGYVDFNNSFSQVGEYRLHMEDTTWTTVDYNPIYMSHHDNSANYFIPSTTADCLSASSTTQIINSTTKNGCNISSNHNSSTTDLKYRDYNIEFHPYKFDLSSLRQSVGLNNDLITPNSYVYMADISQDENMSYHINGNIRASGYDDSLLTNYVNNCYAKAVDINITRTMDLVGNTPYQYKFNALDTNNTLISTTSGDLNNSAGPIQLSEGDFSKNTNGSINSNLNLNFFRQNSILLNPKQVLFHLYSTECSNSSECSFNAELTSKTTHGETNIDNNITYYYGRSHTSRQRYEGNTGSANIYYETYCFGTDLSGKLCDRTLLQQGVNSKKASDIRWFINENHNLNFGDSGTVTENNSLARVTVAGSSTGNHPDNSTLMTYNESRGYPYKTTMQNNASRWLIYNQYDANATRNNFSVEFEGDESYWSGIHETESSTKDSTIIKSNRRSMW